MKQLLLLICMFPLLASCGGNTNKTSSTDFISAKLILDTDLGPDYDDVGAMAVMHALADSGLVDILGVISSNKNDLVVPCIDVINTYFNRPSIPTGAPKSEGGVDIGTGYKSKWTEAIVANYPHKAISTTDAPDAVKVYRKILSSQPDSSVVICTVGFLTNMKDLLYSTADEYSPLSGEELIKLKVARLVSMAGWFPEGREFNVHCDTPASIVVADEWPTEIVFSGLDIGNDVLTGKKLMLSDIENSPVKDVYTMGITELDTNGRMSWDLTAVLVAIKGYEPYYTVERGTMFVKEDGVNGWIPSESGKHLSLVKKMPTADMAELLNNYIMHQPTTKK